MGSRGKVPVGGMGLWGKKFPRSWSIFTQNIEIFAIPEIVNGPTNTGNCLTKNGLTYTKQDNNFKLDLFLFVLIAIDTRPDVYIKNTSFSLKTVKKLTTYDGKDSSDRVWAIEHGRVDEIRRLAY